MRGSRIAAIVAALSLGSGLAARGQLSRTATDPAGASTARIETATLDVVQPDAYRVPIVLEPIRSVAIKATEDGIVQNITVSVGDTVRDSQEVARMDGSEAQARLAIAQAEVKERLAATQQGATPQAVAEAQLEAARARAELAQITVDRGTLRAPFPGVIHGVAVSNGQYVEKGATIAELADVSSLRVLLPVDRTAVKTGETIRLGVEGQTVEGRILALIPLPETFSVIRTLATPWAAAWVEVPAPATLGLQPGQRVDDPFLPSSPIAVVPARAVRGSRQVQVIRNEHVASIPVRVLGELSPERVQVSGALRPGDSVIVESSVSLADGTFVRFGSRPGPSVETTPPDPDAAGGVAEIGRASPPSRATSIPPIGAQDGAPPAATTRSPAPTRTRTQQAPARPATKPATPPGAIPF